MYTAITTTRFAITEIIFNEFREQILDLRLRCRQDKDPTLLKQLFPAGMHDEFDESAIHWGIFNGQTLIACSRMSVHREIAELPDRYLFSDIWGHELPAPIASLNRLSVDTNYRGRGIAAEMDTIRLKKAIRIGCKCVAGTAHGNRSRKLSEDGFQCRHSKLLSQVSGMCELTGRAQPLDFYYKLLI